MPVPRFEVLENENTALRKQLIAMQLENEKLAGALIALKPGAEAEVLSPVALLLYTGIFIAGRAVLFVFMQDMGRKVSWESQTADFIFGLGIGLLLILWVMAEFAVNEIPTIFKGVTIIVGFLMAMSMFDDGKVLRSFLLAEGSLLLAASPFCRWAMEVMETFIGEPFGSIDSLFKNIVRSLRNEE